MNKIKFSHKYTKMPPDTKDTYLLEVLVSGGTHELSTGFLEYDTTTVCGDHYKLPAGKLLILLLMTKNRVWTTIRSYNPEKEKYYRSIRGQMVEIVGE